MRLSDDIKQVHLVDVHVVPLTLGKLCEVAGARLLSGCLIDEVVVGVLDAHVSGLVE